MSGFWTDPASLLYWIFTRNDKVEWICLEWKVVFALKAILVQTENIRLVNFSKNFWEYLNSTSQKCSFTRWVMTNLQRVLSAPWSYLQSCLFITICLKVNIILCVVLFMIVLFGKAELWRFMKFVGCSCAFDTLRKTRIEFNRSNKLICACYSYNEHVDYGTFILLAKIGWKTST